MVPGVVVSDEHRRPLRDEPKCRRSVSSHFKPYITRCLSLCTYIHYSGPSLVLLPWLLIIFILKDSSLWREALPASSALLMISNFSRLLITREFYSYLEELLGL